jgi:hypothetical protein
MLMALTCRWADSSGVKAWVRTSVFLKEGLIVGLKRSKSSSTGSEVTRTSSAMGLLTRNSKGASIQARRQLIINAPIEDLNYDVILALYAGSQIRSTAVTNS